MKNNKLDNWKMKHLWVNPVWRFWHFSKINMFFTYILPRFFSRNKLFIFTFEDNHIVFVYGRNEREAWHYFDKRIQESYDNSKCKEIKPPYVFRVNGDITYWDENEIHKEQKEMCDKHNALIINRRKEFFNKLSKLIYNETQEGWYAGDNTEENGVEYAETRIVEIIDFLEKEIYRYKGYPESVIKKIWKEKEEVLNDGILEEIPDIEEIDLIQIKEELIMDEQKNFDYSYYLKQFFGLTTEKDELEHARNLIDNYGFGISEEFVTPNKVFTWADANIDITKMKDDVYIQYCEKDKILWIESEFGAYAYYICDTIEKSFMITNCGGEDGWKEACYYVNYFLKTGKTQWGE